jgi:two-component system, LytTR family, response regulator
MRTFRALVVDDEPLAREVVVDLLRRDSEIASITELGDPSKVAGMLSTDRADILFLDIEMPGLSGLQIASAVANNGRLAIVFVTAFGEYALNAFDLEATDYLLKPFSDARFFQALDRAKRRVMDRQRQTAPSTADVHEDNLRGRTSAPYTSLLTRFSVGHGEDAVTIAAAEVLWVEADDYYVRLHTRHGRHLLRVSMASLEERMDPRIFVRSHRAAIVNVREIQRIDPDGTVLVLSDGSHVPVSRSRRPIVERIVRSVNGASGE